MTVRHSLRTLKRSKKRKTIKKGGQNASNNIKRKIKEIPTTFNVLGKGSYGSVLAPPLPNKETIPPIFGVTKIYVKEPSIQKTQQFKQFVNQTANISNNTKQRYNYYKYKYFQDYKLKNIFPKLSNNNVKVLRKEFKVQTNKNANELIYPIAFPHLGLSFVDIVEQEREARPGLDYYLCYEILDCMKIIQTVVNNKYIHGDIRETNVMLQLESLEMTIIDFDWLYPWNIYYKRMYENQKPTRLFYPHPPECLFVTEIWKLIQEVILQDETSVKKRLKDFWYNIQKLRVVESSVNYQYVQFDIDDSYVDSIYQFFKDNYDSKESIGLLLFETEASYFIDSYGFAYAISFLLFGNYPIYESLQNKTTWNLKEHPLVEGIWSEDTIQSNPIRQWFRTELLPNMLHPDFRQRWYIDDAINELQRRLPVINRS